MKRICTFLFVLVTAVYAYGFTVDGLTYVTTSYYGGGVEVYRIEDKSFTGSLIIPNTVTYEGKTYPIKVIYFEAFEDCTGLKSVIIGDSVRAIYGEAFKGCTALKTVLMGESVEHIGYNCFENCTSLTTFNIPESVTQVREEAFKNTAWLNSQPDGFLYKDNILLGYKGKRQYHFEGDRIYGVELNIKYGTRVIADEAFVNYYFLSSVTIPNTVTHIGRAAFFGSCVSTSCSFTIPKSVISIGYQTFEGNNSLKKLKVESGNPVYDSREDCNAIIETATNKLVAGSRYTVIPSTVTTIGEGAFYAWRQITNIAIPGHITKIEERAFNSLWGGNVRSMITNPFPIKGKDAGSFYRTFDYDELRTLYVPYGSKTLYETTEGWKDFEKIEEMGYDEDFFYDVLPDGTLAVTGNSISRHTKMEIPETKFVDGKERKVTTISEEAFAGMELVTEIDIPATIDSIGRYALKECDGLSTIKVNPNNKTLDSRNNCNCIIFTANDSLVAGCKTSTIPSSIKHIGDYAFYYCEGLKTVDIPDGVNTIGYCAFYQCEELSSISIGDSVKEIDGLAFSGTAWYDAQPNGILYLDNWLVDVKGSKLEGDVMITEGTKGIANRAMADNSSMTRVIIPNSVKYIGSAAFIRCTGLKEIYSQIKEPFAIADNVFSYWNGEAKENRTIEATLYVPVGTKAKYEATDGWKNFTNIVETDFKEESQGDVNGDNVVDVADIASVISVMASSTEPQSGTAPNPADVNGDGVVDVADIATIISEMAAQARMQ